MRRSVRRCYEETGYVYATGAMEIARRSGKERIARLASNENPFPPPPAVLDAAILALRGVNRYPAEEPRALLEALRKFHMAMMVMPSGRCIGPSSPGVPVPGV